MISFERARFEPSTVKRSPGPRRWANAPVKWLLRSPLHAMIDERLMLVTIRGRATGRQFTIPVGYVAGIDGWYVLVGQHRSKRWWRNLEHGADVTLTLHGEKIAAHARVMRWHTNHSVFEGAFGLYLRRFPRTARRLGVPMLGGVPDPAVLREVARDTVLVRAARPH